MQQDNPAPSAPIRPDRWPTGITAYKPRRLGSTSRPPRANQVTLPVFHGECPTRRKIETANRNMGDWTRWSDILHSMGIAATYILLDLGGKRAFQRRSATSSGRIGHFAALRSITYAILRTLSPPAKLRSAPAYRLPSISDFLLSPCTTLEIETQHRLTSRSALGSDWQTIGFFAVFGARAPKFRLRVTRDSRGSRKSDHQELFLCRNHRSFYALATIAFRANRQEHRR